MTQQYLASFSGGPCDGTHLVVTEVKRYVTRAHARLATTGVRPDGPIPMMHFDATTYELDCTHGSARLVAGAVAEQSMVAASHAGGLVEVRQIKAGGRLLYRLLNSTPFRYRFGATRAREQAPADFARETAATLEEELAKLPRLPRGWEWGTELIARPDVDEDDERWYRIQPRS